MWKKFWFITVTAYPPMNHCGDEHILAWPEQLTRTAASLPGRENGRRQPKLDSICMWITGIVLLAWKQKTPGAKFRLWARPPRTWARSHRAKHPEWFDLLEDHPPAGRFNGKLWRSHNSWPLGPTKSGKMWERCGKDGKQTTGIWFVCYPQTTIMLLMLHDDLIHRSQMIPVKHSSGPRASVFRTFRWYFSRLARRSRSGTSRAQISQAFCKLWQWTTRLTVLCSQLCAARKAALTKQSRWSPQHTDCGLTWRRL